MMRGRLRVYLGAAPGVGKTYAMLDEGRRRAGRGTDVVVGFAEPHGRPRTAELVEDLRVVPCVEQHEATFPEMDVDAVLARNPKVALVDELAHTNAPGSRNGKRYEDVEELLAAGITVITTVNIQHLESLNDVVERITGLAQRETLPDHVVRGADQIELVDMDPQAIRRRMAHGNIYPPDRITPALANYFREGNLTALRELALLWLADEVDQGLADYRQRHQIAEPWETRERVVVALTGGPEGETLIRRAARIAERTAGGDLLAVHITRSDGLVRADPAQLARQRKLAESLGASYHQVLGDDVPSALLEFARAENATQIVLGASRRTRLGRFVAGPGIGATVVSESGAIDVHMVTHERAAGGRRLPRPSGGLTRRRRVAGFALTLFGLPALTAVLIALRGQLSLGGHLLVFLLAIVGIALIGGLWPALLTAVLSSQLTNYYFTPPYYTFAISTKQNILTLGVFILVAIAVSLVVDTAARRTRQAVRANAEADTLRTLAGSVLRGEDALPALLDRARETFAMTSAALLERRSGTSAEGEWACIAATDDTAAPAGPDEADTAVPTGDGQVLTLTGRSLNAFDRRVASAFAAQATTALQQARLAEEAAAVGPLTEANELRTALLAAVSHDLRSPLASATAAVTSLRTSDVTWSAEQQTELLSTAEQALHRLTRLVDNLLDISRLRTGSLTVTTRPVALHDVLAEALDDLALPPDAIRLELPEHLPDIDVDPALLERVLANLITNAQRHSPPGRSPSITASPVGEKLEVRVADAGPGIPAEQREQMFTPFQRLGDTDNTTGLGLGLALARGLTHAMAGSLVPEDTPGGGLTMTLNLPVTQPGPPSDEQNVPEPDIPGEQS